VRGAISAALGTDQISGSRGRRKREKPHDLDVRRFRAAATKSTKSAGGF
jgi:hypothetical protein